jgi:flagellar biosynthetic protein FlhB
VAEDNGEKTFAPSEKRKRDAAKRGDVLRSRESPPRSPCWWRRLAEVRRPLGADRTGRHRARGFSWDRGTLEDFSPDQMIVPAIVALLPPVLVLGGLIMAASLGSQIGLSDGRWVGSNLAPKASRINPLSGLKRMLGLQGWIELGKGLAKLALLGSIAYCGCAGGFPGWLAWAVAKCGCSWPMPGIRCSRCCSCWPAGWS